MPMTNVYKIFIAFMIAKAFTMLRKEEFGVK